MNKRYTASIAAGLLAVPLLALGANALLSPEEDDDYYEDTTTTAVVQTIAPVTTESRATYLEDVIRACGVEADYLLELETGGFISPEQKAALDALREVCDQEGLPLAGPPAGDPIVETNTVFRDIPVVTPAAQVSPTTTIATQEAATTSVDDTTTTTVPGYEDEDEDEDDDEDEEYEDDDQEYEYEEHEYENDDEHEGSQVSSMQATALAAYQSAADAINANWTDDAEELFREGEEKYNKGEWKDAVEKFTKARNEATGGI